MKSTSIKWSVTLILLLAYRDIRVRYKRAWLGVLWALGVPLMLAAIFTVVYKGFFRAAIPNYSFFVLSALFPWMFFQGAVTVATQSFLSSSELLKTVPLPRPVLPLAAVAVEAFHLVIALALLCFIIVVRGGTPGAHWFALFPFLLTTYASAAGIGLLLAPLQVRFRDVKYLVDIALMAAFYAAPVIYTAEMVPRPWRIWVVWNPIGILIRPFRDILYYNVFPSPAIWALSAVLSLIFLTAGISASVHGGKTAADYV